MRTVMTLFAAGFVLLSAVACGGSAEKWASMMPDENFSNWRVASGDPSPGSSSEEIVLTDNKVMLFGAKDTAVPLPEFRNFVLTARVLAEPGAASSLWFHHGDEYGYEIVLGERRLDGARHTTGSLNNVRNVYKSMAAAGEWFDLKVTVSGKNIVVKINDIPVVDYVEPAKPHRAMPGISLLGAGTFVLDSYEGATRVRDMKFRQLPDDAAGRTDAVDETADPVIRLQQAGFPVIDFHVHLKGWDKNAAMENSRRTGIFYGIAPNCGIGFPITTDAEIDNFIDTTRNLSAFMAMQGEGREWPQTFSRASMRKFDYVFTDALTFTDHAGRRVRLWIDDEVVIDIPQEQYMDLIVDKTVEVIRGEPINIFVNPCFLPTEMMPDYDAFWTDSRIERVVAALVEKGVALEVNARYRIPNAKIIRAAMDAGVKFAFGTNNADSDIGKLEYCLEMIEQCGITPEHMYFPAGIE